MTSDSGPEGRYLLDFDTRDLPRYATDVLVIGGGVAGLSAALAAAEHSHVLLLMKDPLESTNTAWAQGGIAAAVGADDSPEAHVADTLRTGGTLCDEAVVREVARAAPAAIERLAALGTEFDRDNGGLQLGQEGGHRHRRVVHSHGDATGLECVRRLAAAAKAAPRVHLQSRAFLLDLITVDGRCVGALAWREHGERFAVFARTVILAAGGAGRLFRESSNVRGATGDGIVAAYRAGATLKDLEFVQFHPTTLYLAGIERALVTEAVRGEGARLVDNDGVRFLEAVHPAAELAPRDVVSRAIVAHLGRPGVTGVFLDLRHWPKGRVAERFPGLAERCVRYGVDPETELLPVRPAAHYFIGGVACDLDGRTDVRGLFVCGEASCSGLHGANRLASNSLLEGLVLGERTGRVAAAEGGERYDRNLSHKTGRRPREAGEGAFDLEDLRKALASRMWRCLGVVRDGSGLAESEEALATWRKFSARLPLFRRGAFELENMLTLSSLVSAAAARREESRGVHYRFDFPETDDGRFLGSFLWQRGREGRFVAKG